MTTAVLSVPGAVGGAFAASDGETVDGFAGEQTPYEWALVTAHFGVIFSMIQRSTKKNFSSFAKSVVIRLSEYDIVLKSVEDGYYAIMALQGTGQIGSAIKALNIASIALKKEMS